MIWLIALGAAGCVGLLFLPKHPKHPKLQASPNVNELYNHSRVILTSQKKYGEVDIPFTFRDGIICLQMTWSGKSVEAILDTGSSCVEWPETLHLTSMKTGLPQEGVMAAGVTTDGEWRVVPSIKVGGCEWREMPTAAAGIMKVQGSPNKGPQMKPTAPPRPLLGVPAFRNLVLTIDYQNKRIILRSPVYDITHLSRRPQDRLLTPDWDQGYLPILKGRLANRPARFAVDTGCEGIDITTKFAHQLPSSYSYNTTTTNINGQPVKVQRLKHISGIVMARKLEAFYTLVMNISIQSDALIGTVLLKHYRVTFDYTRGKLLMEPYPVKAFGDGATVRPKQRQ